jgi:hypothetical protein
MFIASTPPDPAKLRQERYDSIGDGLADRPLRPRNMPLLRSLVAPNCAVAINMALLTELSCRRTQVCYCGGRSWVDDGGRSPRRNAPVLERSKHRVFQCIRFHWGPLTFLHCCTRGRAHRDNAAALSLTHYGGRFRQSQIPRFTLRMRLLTSSPTRYGGRGGSRRSWR